MEYIYKGKSKRLTILYREGSDYFTFWWENVAVKALMEKTAISSENFIERERERQRADDDGGKWLGGNANAHRRRWGVLASLRRSNDYYYILFVFI